MNSKEKENWVLRNGNSKRAKFFIYKDMMLSTFNEERSRVKIFDKVDASPFSCEFDLAFSRLKRLFNDTDDLNPNDQCWDDARKDVDKIADIYFLVNKE